MKRLLIIFSLFTSNLLCESELVDLIVFSYNRPMQLYALLESVEKYLTGLGEISVIYRASDSAYETGYEIVKTKFKPVRYFKQGDTPNKDFKPLILKAWDTKQEYLMFSTDDIIVKSPADLTVCTNALKSTDAYGFYLRLGKNISKSYFTGDKISDLPKHKLIEPGIYSYKFSDSTGADWRYPNTVDMTIYPKNKIKEFFAKHAYANPNSCEGSWAAQANLSLQGLFFEKSKIVNIPLNLVNEVAPNAHMNSHSAAEMLKFFNQGLKIDIDDFYEFNNQAPHVNYQVKFIAR